MSHFKTTLHTMEPLCDHWLELHDFPNIDEWLLFCNCMSHNNQMWFRVYMFANVFISTLICCCMNFFLMIYWNSMYFWISIQVHFQVCIQLSLPKSYDKMLRKKLQSFISLISFMALMISLTNISSKILKI
jgi:hypothetical protein